MDKRRGEGKSVENITKGIYILEIFAAKPFSVSIKKYRERIFKRGYYYYTGSAQKNLSQRTTRHLRKEKIIHWHIDHVTTVKSNNIKTIFIYPEAPKDLECGIANHLENDLQVDSSIKGFGNSDSNCSSTHLFYSNKKLDHSHLCSLYQSTVRFIPSSKETR